MQHAAPRNGDFVTPTVVGAEEYDYAERDLRYTRPMFELLTTDREFGDQNKAKLQQWLSVWMPRAIAASRTMQPLWSQPECEAAPVRGWPGRSRRPVQRHPLRSAPGKPEGAGPVTTFKTTESPFKSDNTASNQWRVNPDEQPGRRAVVAEVMKHEAQRVRAWRCRR